MFRKKWESQVGGLWINNSVFRQRRTRTPGSCSWGRGARRVTACHSYCLRTGPRPAYLSTCTSALPTLQLHWRLTSSFIKAWRFKTTTQKMRDCVGQSLFVHDGPGWWCWSVWQINWHNQSFKFESLKMRESPKNIMICKSVMKNIWILTGVNNILSFHPFVKLKIKHWKCQHFKFLEYFVSNNWLK